MFRPLIALTAVLALFLSGCQHMNIPTDSLTFQGKDYHGKESLPAFFTNHHKLYESSGNEFRGYRLKNRHWYFK